MRQKLFFIIPFTFSKLGYNGIILFDESSNNLLFKIISAIDLFLIGIVLLIFGFGIYELFVSEIDFANAKFTESTLKIRDLDQLKNKIIKVVIIVLIVKFFEKVLKFSENFTTPMDILFHILVYQSFLFVLVTI